MGTRASWLDGGEIEAAHLEAEVDLGTLGIAGGELDAVDLEGERVAFEPLLRALIGVAVFSHRPTGLPPVRAASLRCRNRVTGRTDLPAVTVAFINQRLLIRLRRLRSWFQLAGIRAQAHRATHISKMRLVWHQADNGMVYLGIEFRAVDIFSA